MQNLSKDDSLKNALSIKLVSHFKGQYKNSIFLDSGPTRQNKLIYPSANTIAFNTLTPSFQNDKNQTFINALPGSKGITCIAQSQNKKYLAWCEQTDSVPIIFLIDLADPQLKRRPLAAGQIKNKKFVSLTFNGTQISDPKFLVALTNGPDHNIIQWNFEKGKYFIHSLEKNQKIQKTIGGIQKFSQIFFYRQEDTIVAMGKGNLKFFKISTQKLQIKDSPFARRQINQKDYNFTSFCIMKQNLIVGTDSGDLFYFAANGQFKAILLSSPGQNYSIETLLYLPNTNKSFLVGGSDGLLLLYEKSDSKDPKNIYIRSNRKFPIKEYRGRISSLMSTPKQNDIFIGLNTGIILRMSLQKNQQSVIDYALQSFHTDNITGLDVCLRKSLVGTCSADRSVRIWNFLQKNNLQVVKNFDQKPLSLSFHPSGLHIIVTFPDKVRLINILENQLVSYKDLPIKNCYEVKFSHGGHLFAVVNNVMVQIFDFYTLDQPSHYQFKAQAGKFQTMTWQQDDLALYLGTSDGFVFFYKLQDPSVRLQILSVPGLSIKTIASIFVGKDEKQGLINERTVYASGIFGQSITDDNKCIYQVKITPKTEKQKQRESFREQQNKYTCSTPIKIYTFSDVIRIAFLNSKKIMFYCTRKQEGAGTIRYCRYPLHSTKQICQLQGHSRAINRLAITHDDNYIFSAGEQGQFLCYDFKDKQFKVKIQIPDLSQQFLYSKPKLGNQKRQFDQLRQDNAQAKQKRERALRQSKAENERLVNEWNFKINERQRTQKQKYEKQVDLISQMQKEQSKKLNKLQIQHKQKRQAVEKDYSDKIQLQQTRFTELGKTRQGQNKKFHQYIETVKNNHIKTKQRKQLQFRQQLAKQKQQLQHYQKVFEQLKKKYQQQQQGDQNEAEKDIKAKKQDNQVTIKDLIKQNQKAQSQKRFKKQTLDKYQRDLEQENHKLKHTHEDIEKIKQKHQQNLQKKQSQAKQIQQRQKTIRDKVTRINQLKKKTQQLQKFKFVLDYKIKQLKRDIGPREEQISKMKQQIANMNSQIIHFKRTNDNMNLIVKDLVSKRNGMDKEIEGLNQTQNKNLVLIKSFQYDVSQMYQNFIKDYKGLKAKVVQIYRKYVQQQNRKKADGVDQQKQFIKERAHLQSTVRGLKQKFKRKIQLHEADNKRIMSQNQQLISEINDLKRQKKNLKDDSMKRQLVKEASIRLQEQRIIIDKEYENLQKTLRQLKIEYEKKIKRKKEGIQA